MLLGLLFRNPNGLLYFDKEHRQNDRSFEYQQHTGLCVRRYFQIGIDCQKRNGNAIRNVRFRKKIHPQQNIKDFCLHAYYPLCIVRVVKETA